jgi:hypothetical protein
MHLAANDRGVAWNGLVAFLGRYMGARRIALGKVAACPSGVTLIATEAGGKGSLWPLPEQARSRVSVLFSRVMAEAVNAATKESDSVAQHDPLTVETIERMRAAWADGVASLLK